MSVEILQSVAASLSIEVDNDHVGRYGPADVGMTPFAPPGANCRIVRRRIFQPMRGERLLVRADGEDRHAGAGVGERPIDWRIGRRGLEVRETHAASRPRSASSASGRTCR